MALLLYRLYDFTPSTTIVSAQVDAEFDAVLAAINLINNYTEPYTVASIASLALDCDDYGLAYVTAQAVAIDIPNPTGTPKAGQSLIFVIKDDGNAQDITYGSNFVGIGFTLPDTTEAGKWIYIGAKWNATSSKWHVLAVNPE